MRRPENEEQQGLLDDDASRHISSSEEIELRDLLDDDDRAPRQIWSLRSLSPERRKSYRHTPTLQLPRRRRVRTCSSLTLLTLSTLLLLLLPTGLLFPSYSHPPQRYRALRRHIHAAPNQPGRANLHNEKTFLAASLYDAPGELVSGDWGKSVSDLIHLLGPANVHLSIYEHDAEDRSKAALEDFRKSVSCNYVDHGTRRLKRIAFPAEVPNRALSPVHDPASPASRTRFDQVLYINDVVFDPVDAANLLFSTNVDETSGRPRYRAACATDFINPFKFYDNFATRDLDGYSMGVPFYPWIIGADGGTSRKYVLERKDAVRVKSCWGGMVAFEARWFQPSLQPNSSSLAEQPQAPLRFRGVNETYWEASECCVIHADLTALAPEELAPAETGIFLNPYVRVAYSRKSLDWLAFTRRFERLYAPAQTIANWFAGRPSYNPRRLEEPGQPAVNRVWVWHPDSQDAGRIARNVQQHAPDGQALWRGRLAADYATKGRRRLLLWATSSLSLWETLAESTLMIPQRPDGGAVSGHTGTALVESVSTTGKLDCPIPDRPTETSPTAVPLSPVFHAPLMSVSRRAKQPSVSGPAAAVGHAECVRFVQQNSICKAWDYSSTCSSVYTTQTQTSSKPESSVYTTTSYKPETVTVTSASTAYETKYSTVVSMKTKYETKTKTIPYNSESQTVICYTKPVWVWTHSTSLYSTAETYPETTTLRSVSTQVSAGPHTYVTSTPCPETLTSSYEKTYYVTKSVFVSTGCSKVSTCVSSSSTQSSSSTPSASPTFLNAHSFDLQVVYIYADSLDLLVLYADSTGLPLVLHADCPGLLLVLDADSPRLLLVLDADSPGLLLVLDADCPGLLLVLGADSPGLPVVIYSDCPDLPLVLADCPDLPVLYADCPDLLLFLYANSPGLPVVLYADCPDLPVVLYADCPDLLLFLYANSPGLPVVHSDCPDLPVVLYADCPDLPLILYANSPGLPVVHSDCPDLPVVLYADCPDLLLFLYADCPDLPLMVRADSSGLPVVIYADCPDLPLVVRADSSGLPVVLHADCPDLPVIYAYSLDLPVLCADSPGLPVIYADSPGLPVVIHADCPGLFVLYAHSLDLFVLYADSLGLLVLYADCPGLPVIHADSLGLPVIYADALDLFVLYAHSLDLLVLYADSLGLPVIYADSLGLPVIYADALDLLLVIYADPFDLQLILFLMEKQILQLVGIEAAVLLINKTIIQQLACPIRL
ncbi:hypothetical protein B0A55_06418 [Friedmanniomyces simplex]|uniref:Glycosyltransferase family 69 protein n=1 Tax=Friedmanniomyces simplex TaxID=329884 RepID=A0A4U0XAZ7_9PEZI|nr:hypothetical protein B0A55_06418 [Friedmanniomyces simplex]